MKRKVFKRYAILQDSRTFASVVENSLGGNGENLEVLFYSDEEAKEFMDISGQDGKIVEVEVVVKKVVKI